jgi:hypothetical protein
VSLAASTPRVSSEAGSIQADQIYVTHCTQEDSYRNQAGFNIRASSTDDAELLKFAFDYSGYELPLDMWRPNPLPRQAPRRLALVAAPGGRMALIHTAYVQQDTRGRPGSYFSHLLVARHLTLGQALRTWGSADWKTEHDQDPKKPLAVLTRLPSNGSLNDVALVAFLNDGAGINADQDLATQIYPSRLQAQGQRRRDLLGQMLQGCLQALEAGGLAGAAAPRGRFYLLAEPGLSALLLYGALRLLPAGWLDGVTFSTYESAHGSLRQFKLAQILGTYTSSTHKSLDPDLFLTRGYALDTFAPDKCSAELRELAPVVRDLVSLAARGDWQGIRQRHQFCAATPVSLTALSAGQDIYEAGQRLIGHQATFADFQTLRRAESGRPLLDQEKAYVWDRVRDWARTEEAVRQEYADLLHEHYHELWESAVRELAAASPQWAESWSLLKHIQRRAKLDSRHHFLQFIKEAGGSVPQAPLTPVRLALLKEWQGLQPDPSRLPEPIRALFTVRSEDDFTQLRDADLPVEWQGAMLHQILIEPSTLPLGMRLLRNADNRLTAAFCRDLSQAAPARQLQTLLAIVDKQGPKAPEYLEHMLRSGLDLAGDTLDELLTKVNGYDGDWDAFWLAGDHLVLLLQKLERCHEARERIWKRFCDRLDQGLLLGDRSQDQCFRALWAASETLGDYAAPTRCQDALSDWYLLRQHFTNPEDNDGARARDLEDACKRRRTNPLDLLRAYFEKHLQTKTTTSPEADHFVTVFKGFFGYGHSQEEQHAMAIRWLLTLKGCSDPTRKAQYQLFFFQRHILHKHRLAIASDCAGQQLLDPRVLQNLRQAPDPEEVASPVVIRPVATFAPAATTFEPPELGMPYPRAYDPYAGAVPPVDLSPPSYGTPAGPKPSRDPVVSSALRRFLSRRFFIVLVLLLILLPTVAIISSLKGPADSSPPATPADKTSPEKAAKDKPSSILAEQKPHTDKPAPSPNANQPITQRPGTGPGVPPSDSRTQPQPAQTNLPAKTPDKPQPGKTTDPPPRRNARRINGPAVKTLITLLQSDLHGLRNRPRAHVPVNDDLQNKLEDEVAKLRGLTGPGGELNHLVTRPDGVTTEQARKIEAIATDIVAAYRGPMAEVKAEAYRAFRTSSLDLPALEKYFESLLKGASDDKNKLACANLERSLRTFLFYLLLYQVEKSNLLSVKNLTALGGGFESYREKFDTPDPTRDRMRRVLSITTEIIRYTAIDEPPSGRDPSKGNTSRANPVRLINLIDKVLGDLCELDKGKADTTKQSLGKVREELSQNAERGTDNQSRASSTNPVRELISLLISDLNQLLTEMDPWFEGRKNGLRERLMIEATALEDQLKKYDESSSIAELDAWGSNSKLDHIIGDIDASYTRALAIKHEVYQLCDAAPVAGNRKQQFAGFFTSLVQGIHGCTTERSKDYQEAIDEFLLEALVYKAYTEADLDPTSAEDLRLLFTYKESPRADDLEKKQIKILRSIWITYICDTSLPSERAARERLKGFIDNGLKQCNYFELPYFRNYRSKASEALKARENLRRSISGGR